MNAKTTMVTLQAGVIIQEFEFETAERILQIPNNGGWKVADDKFEFVDNALRFKKDKKTGK